VNSPGPPGADFCGAGSGAGGGDEGACGVPESALNICVKLLGGSEECAEGWIGSEAAGGSAFSGVGDAGFSMETWRKMPAIPALGVPGVLKVCNILVNSPGAEEVRATGGVGDGDAEGAGEAVSADGRRSDASRSSSDGFAGVSFTLPKAAVMPSDSPEPDEVCPGESGAPKGVLDSLIKPLPLKIACLYGSQGYIANCLTVK